MSRQHIHALLGIAAASLTASAVDHPNILLFLADDLGWQDTSVPFGPDTTAQNRTFRTPAMQRLANSGMMFTQAYACPLSSASRCSLLTGVNNARHRVTNWTLHRNQPVDLPSQTVTLPQWNYNGIQPCDSIENGFNAVSFVDALNRAGYATIHVGKAHFGAKNTPGEDPLNWGFDINIAGSGAGGLATYLSEQRFGHNKHGNSTSPMSTPGLEKYWDTGTFITQALTLEAIAALDSIHSANPSTPWFLNMAHYAVHIPIDTDPRFYQSYIDRGLDSKEAAYAALVEGLDHSLGQLLDYLDQSGQANNTIVIFLSDNGGLATQPQWRSGDPYTQNAPLSCGKGSLHEGGIRVPMLIRWPGVTPHASKTASPVIIEDIPLTILQIAQISDSTFSKQADGLSFAPLLHHRQVPGTSNRNFIWNFPNIWGNTGPGINLNCAIRRGPWKLIHYYETGHKELFNIESDISEKNNLVQHFPMLTQFLARQLGDELRKMNAQRPSFKASGTHCPWPDEPFLVNYSETQSPDY